MSFDPIKAAAQKGNTQAQKLLAITQPTPVSPPPASTPSSGGGGGSSGGGSTQTTPTSKERFIALITGQPSESIEKSKNEISILKTQESAPKVMTDQGKRDWAIRQEISQGVLPVGYGNIPSSRTLTKNQGLQEIGGFTDVSKMS